MAYKPGSSSAGERKSKKRVRIVLVHILDDKQDVIDTKYRVENCDFPYEALNEFVTFDEALAFIRSNENELELTLG